LQSQPMAVETLLRPSEQEWAGALTNLAERFAQLDPSVVLDILRQNEGHAGRTAKALRALAPEAAISTKPAKQEVSATQPTKVPAVTVAPKQESEPAKAPSPAKAPAPRKQPDKVKATPAPAVAAAAAASEALPPVDSKLLFVAALQGDIQQLTWLINAGADLNGRYTGRPGDKADKIIDATPLHIVVTMGRADVAEALLRHGANVESKMCRALGSGKPPEEQYAEMTPLHLAAMEGHTNIVEMLVAFGADKGARMQLTEIKWGEHSSRTITPLEIAHEMVSKGHSRESVISVLSK
jgi:hypothetical protein